MHSPTNDAPSSDSPETEPSREPAQPLPRQTPSPKQTPSADPKPLDDRLSNLSPAQKQLLLKRLAQRRGKPASEPKADARPEPDPARAAVPVAIVGMGCRFPGAATLDQFWDLIASGGEAVGPIPADRWSRDQFYDPTGRSPGKMSVDAIGAIDGVDQFDPAFFGIAPREAARMDPQQRLLLEVVWETFENAGLPIDSFAGTDTGVFIGIGGTDYSKVPARYPNYFDHVDAHIGTGNALSIAAGRISYLFDFRGPSYIVDTACSSALVAIDNACASLAAGTSDAAIAGGVNLILSPETTIAFSKARMLSPDGHCRPFDDGANGYVRGEGCGIVLLKRLADARRDGDQILGIIRGTAVNQDGRTSGITAPSGAAQQRVIATALAQARLRVDDITYVEAHGTGTPLGDPIELSALAETFAARAAGLPPVRIGSVKANIGHTETASGIAGLIKVLLMMQRGVIPAQANFTRLNSNVPARLKTLAVAETTSPWTSTPNGRRIAGVSSFGFGGTNSHLIVESPESPSSQTVAPERDIAAPPTFVLPISAADEPALQASANRYATLLADASRTRVADVCGTAATGRTALGLRLAVVGDDAQALTDQMRQIAVGGAAKISGRKPAGRRVRVAMLFTGQGSQYARMGDRLAKTMPVFADALESCAAAIDDDLPAPLRRILAGTANLPDGRSIDHTSLTQVAITAVQCSLVDTFRYFGVKPDIVAGHSIGEIAALYAIGVLTRDDALRIAMLRGKCMGDLPAGGAMAAILAPAAAVESMIDASKTDAVIATMNGPGNTVIAGTTDSVDALIAIAIDAGHVCKKLSVSHAFHSPLMGPAAERLRTELSAFVQPSSIPRQVTFVSSVTGQRYESPIDVDYWIRHLMQPVRFSDVIDRLRGEKIDLAVEIGPTPQLCGMIRHADRAVKAETPIACAPTLAPERDDFAGWIAALARLWCVGAAVNWSKLSRIYPTDRAELPNYPFQRSRFWYDPPGAGNHGFAGTDAQSHPMLGSRQSLADGRTLFTNVIRKSEPNFIADHVVAGSVTVPAAAWMETIAAAVNTVLGDLFQLRDIAIDKALFLDGGESVTLQITVKPGTARCEITIDARTSPAEATWQRCASATAIKTDEYAPVQPTVTPSGNAASLDRDELYNRLAKSQLQYGRYFQTLHDIRSDGNVATATLRLDDDLTTDSHRYRWHPTLLDGAFQLIATVANVDDQTYLPVGVGRIDVHGDQPIATVTVTKIASNETDALIANVVCGDESGQAVATFTGLRLKSLKRTAGETQLDPARWFHGVEWIPSQTTTPSFNAQPKAPASPWTDSCEAGVFGWALNERFGSVSADDAIPQIQSLSRTIQSALASEPAPPLTIITRGGYTISPDDTPDPVAAAIVAFARVAANEYPSLGIRILDVPDFGDESRAAIDAFLAIESDETESAYRDHQWLHPRLTPQPQQFTVCPPDAETALPVSGSYRMRLDGTNRIEGLWAQRIVPPTAYRGEVTVSIDAVGLNFSDVLKTMGLYPGIKDRVTPLGIEVCGRVTELGEGVTRFAIGDRVMGVVPHGFATDDATNDYLLMPVPEMPGPGSISDAEAASLPIAFATAHHALVNVGRLRRGESVLIHAGAGGVGLAAVQVAQSIGAIVYTTAGNHVKRSLLAELGVDEDHLFDSRDVRSLDRLRAATGGRGVDVVLNSLPGDWIDESLRMLAPYGRFLEIGKTDIYQNRAIGLLPFQDNLSYSAIDLDRMFRDRGDEVRELFDAVYDKFASGDYRPLPITMFDFAELPAAMRFMAARRNIGKIVVTTPLKKTDVAARVGKVVMITGGSGAIARAVARRMIQRGASSVALVARGPGSDDISELQTWATGHGATIGYFRADCSDEASMTTCVADINDSLGPITGVIHAAGVLDDRLLHEMTDESIDRVMRPKVVGAMVLAKVTADQPIESFQFVGSVASVFGSPGQANYAAANGFLEGFAVARRRDGQPANVVHWGPWATGGMADDPVRLKNLAARGLTPLVPSDATDVLIDACDFGDADQTPIVVDADFGVMTSTAGKQLPSMLRGFGGQDSPGAGPTSRKDVSFLTSLVDLDADAKVDALSGYFAVQLGKIMSMNADSFDPNEPLGGLGLDSLMAIELKNTIETKLDVQIPISKFISDPTLSSLAKATADIVAITE